MSGQLTIGILMVLLCLAVQCAVVAALLKELYRIEQRQRITLNLWGVLLVLVVVTVMILAGNLVQIALWAGLFLFVGEFSDFSTAFYHSVVNFSTLGYGDLVMTESHRLLGALEALNGVLMIGLSTGVMFTVLNELMSKAWQQRHQRNGPASRNDV